MLFVIWLVGVLTGCLTLRVFQMVRSGQLRYRWYHWVIAVVWYLLLLFVISFVGTSIAEEAMQAAWMGCLIFGGVTLIVGMLLYRFVFSGPKAQSPEKTVAG